MKEGHLTIKLSVAGGVVSDVDVVSTRLVQAAKVFRGRAPAEVIQLVPLLFPVCGLAQTIACVRSIEGALGIAAGAREEAARDLVGLAEAVVSHVWQLTIAWPKAAGHPEPSMAAVRRARDAMFALGRALFGAAQLGTTVATEIDRDALHAGVRILTSTLREGASDEALLDAVLHANRAGFGAVTSSTLLDWQALGRAVADTDVGEPGRCLALGGEPVGGEPVDRSALLRQRENVAVRAAERAHGPGLLARLIARREDAQASAQELLSASSAFAGETSLARQRGSERSSSPANAAPRTGIGHAMTARGPLVYWSRASSTGEVLEDIRTFAPTDSTFHPRGVVRQALVGESVTSTLARDVDWLVLSLDPCVPWTTTVVPDASGKAVAHA